jgi:hypothetical protein
MDKDRYPYVQQTKPEVNLSGTIDVRDNRGRPSSRCVFAEQVCPVGTRRNRENTCTSRVQWSGSCLSPHRLPLPCLHVSWATLVPTCERRSHMTKAVVVGGASAFSEASAERYCASIWFQLAIVKVIRQRRRKPSHAS